MRFAAIFLALLAHTGLPVLDLAAAEPQHVHYQAGDFVVVVRPSELKVEDKAVDTVQPGVLMGVDQVQGDWLWVTQQKSGWLSSASVIPAQNSVEYFTTAIRRNPADARLYARRGVAPRVEPGLRGGAEGLWRSIRLKPAEAVYYGDRGCFYMAIGDFDHAIADFAEEIRRINGEAESKTAAIRLDWLHQRLAEAQTLKANDAAVTLGALK